MDTHAARGRLIAERERLEDALPAARYCVEDQAKVARARRNGHR